MWPVVGVIVHPLEERRVEVLQRSLVAPRGVVDRVPVVTPHLPVEAPAPNVWLSLPNRADVDRGGRAVVEHHEIGRRILLKSACVQVVAIDHHAAMLSTLEGLVPHRLHRRCVKTLKFKLRLEFSFWFR